jgi:hypothetical protein
MRAACRYISIHRSDAINHRRIHESQFSLFGRVATCASGSAATALEPVVVSPPELPRARLKGFKQHPLPEAVEDALDLTFGAAGTADFTPPVISTLSLTSIADL